MIRAHACVKVGVTGNVILWLAMHFGMRSNYTVMVVDDPVECSMSSDEANDVNERSPAASVDEKFSVHSEVALFLGELGFIHNIPSFRVTLDTSNFSDLVVQTLKLQRASYFYSWKYKVPTYISTNCIAIRLMCN